MKADRDHNWAAAAWWAWALSAAGLLAVACAISTTLGLSLGIVMGAALALWLYRLRNRVRELIERDELTGAASRGGFLARLRNEADRCRAEGVLLSLAVLDCDSFKQVNESFGHCVGDEVLVETADVLLKQTGTRGTVARLWGDAFGILLPMLTADETSRLLEDARIALDARMAQHDWPVTFSVGAITIDNPPSDPQDLLAAADGLMFSVKHRGRNGIVVRRMAADRPVVGVSRPANLASASESGALSKPQPETRGA